MVLKNAVVVAFVPVAFSHVRFVVDAVWRDDKPDTYKLVDVAFVVVALVAVSPVIFAIVAVKVSIIPVVKRASGEKKEVVVAPCANRFVEDAVVEKNDVVVAFVPVAFRNVTFWSVEELITSSVPFIVVVSVSASPSAVLFSTLKLDAVVVERVTDPTVVRLLANTSPSASTKNFTDPFTVAAIRLLSLTALPGFTTSDALNGFAFDVPVAQDEKVCASVGAREKTAPPLKVDVADADEVIVPFNTRSPESVPPVSGK